MDPNDIPTDNLLGECSDEELLREWRRRRCAEIGETELLVCVISKTRESRDDHCATVGYDDKFYLDKWR